MAAKAQIPRRRAHGNAAKVLNSGPRGDDQHVTIHGTRRQVLPCHGLQRPTVTIPRGGRPPRGCLIISARSRLCSGGQQRSPIRGQRMLTPVWCVRYRLAVMRTLYSAMVNLTMT